jgi:hypothetical protein
LTALLPIDSSSELFIVEFLNTFRNVHGTGAGRWRNKNTHKKAAKRSVGRHKTSVTFIIVRSAINYLLQLKLISETIKQVSSDGHAGKVR